MDLLVLSTFEPRDRGTWSGTPASLVSALEREGVRVTTARTTPAAPFHLLALRALSAIEGAELGVAFAFRMQAQRRLRRAMTACNPDGVLHLGVPHGLPGGLGGGRHYLYCDSTWHMRLAEAQYLNPLIRARGRSHLRVDQRERSLLGCFEHIFCTSSAVLEDLSTHYLIPKTTISVIGTGLGGTPAGDRKKDYSRKSVLFVAKHSFGRKGGTLLLEAFRKAKAREPRLQLTIVGSDAVAQGARAIPGVEVLGFVSQEELERLFQQASLYAMPAPYEPWGLVYLEALAAGTAVLGLRRNGLIDISCNGAFGFLVDVPTSDAIAASLVDAMSDEGRLASMGDQGRRHCLATYTWERVASSIVDVVGARQGGARRER